MAKSKGATVVALECQECHSRVYFPPKSAEMVRSGEKLSVLKYCKTERRRTEHGEKKMPNTKPQAQK